LWDRDGFAYGATINFYPGNTSKIVAANPAVGTKASSHLSQPHSPKEISGNLFSSARQNFEQEPLAKEN
jgi:hypothetical protein